MKKPLMGLYRVRVPKTKKVEKHCSIHSLSIHSNPFSSTDTLAISDSCCVLTGTHFCLSCAVDQIAARCWALSFLYYCCPHRTQALSVVFPFKMRWTAEFILDSGAEGGVSLSTWQTSICDVCCSMGVVMSDLYHSVDLHTQLRQGEEQKRPQICRHELTHTCTNKHTHGCQPTSLSIISCTSPSFHMQSNYTGFSIPATGIIITQLSLSLMTSSLSLFLSPWLMALSLLFSPFLPF